MQTPPKANQLASMYAPMTAANTGQSLLTIMLGCTAPLRNVEVYRGPVSWLWNQVTAVSASATDPQGVLRTQTLFGSDLNTLTFRATAVLFGKARGVYSLVFALTYAGQQYTSDIVKMQLVGLK
jgi:hypothetical protein